MGPPPLSTAGDAGPSSTAAADATSSSSSTAGFMPSSPAQATSIAGIGLSAEAAAAAAASAAAGPAGPSTAVPVQIPPLPPISVEPGKGGNRCQHSTRMQILEAKLQVFMDHEDARVKELTEGVLYELLPSALNVMLPNCEDPLTELDPERCRAVAGAALAASALMNAPPGFLEFLLCIPWRRLPQLYPSTAAAGRKVPTASQQQQSEQEPQPQPQPAQQAGQQQDLLAESAADEDERRLLVNLPLHPQLVRPVLQFMYKPQHEDSVPPVLRPEKKQHALKQQQQQAGHQQSQPPQQQLQPGRDGSSDCTADENLLAVAEALLDGATPLHCAALRGNPAQVDHLLFCGADPTRKTAVGDLPLQLVPRCGGYSQATRMCTCLGPSEQAVWECRSRVARTLIANKCITAFRVGLLQYLSLLWLCVLAFLGLNLGAKAAMVRLLAHMQRREEQQAEEARTRTTVALQAMRHEANLGQAHLTLAKQQIGSRHRHQHSSSGSSEGPWAPAAGLLRGASGASSAGSNAAAGGLPGVVFLEGAFGQLGADAGAAAAAAGAAAPRPVATGASAVPGGRVAAGGEGAAAMTAGGQEPVAPGTPSASEEAAAAYSATAKGRRSGSGSLRWAAAEEALGDLTEQQSADSSISGGNSVLGPGHRLGNRALASNQGEGSELHSGQAAAGAVDAQAQQQRQQLLQELLSAVNTSAADASPSLAAAAALALDAEHPWHGPDGGLPLAAHAQTAFSDNAFKCFVRAVHTLQRLNLQDDCMPLAICRGDKSDPLVAPSSAAAAAAAVDSTAGMAAGHAAGTGVTAAASAARFKAAAVAAGVSGAASQGLAAAMSLEAVGSSPRATAPAGVEGMDVSGSHFAAGAGDAGAEQQHLCVLEDEQANLYCCWAESVLLKHNVCACAGCTALAVHAVRIAHIAVVRLFNRVHKQRMRLPLRWRAVGQVLSRIVYVHIALICRTEAAASPSKASVWRAQQCLSEWDQLVAAGLAGGPDQQEAAAALTVGNTVEGVVELLRLWTRTAESDLLIAEALLGSRLSSLTTLDEALTAAFVTPVPPVCSCLLGGAAAMPGRSSTSCLPVLVRPVSAALLSELQSARGLAPCPSPAVKQLAAQVADGTAAELSAGARLRELLAGRVPPSTQEGVAALAAAITAAEPFSSLAADVEAARELHQQSCARAEVASQLQTVVDKVLRLTSRVAVAPGSGSGSSGGGGAAAVAADHGSSSADGSSRDDVLGLPLQGFSVADWQQYVSMLEAAVGAAKDANVSVTKARKLIKELQAQIAAAEAAAGLDACMSRRPCGSSALRQAISKADAAASAVSATATTSLTGGAGPGCSSGGSGSGAAAGAGAAAASAGGAGSSSCVLSELLVVRLQAAKKRLDIERAAEALHKASVTYKSVAELPKLETAVLNARKVGAEELAPDEYKAASELRARLTSALRVKQQLESALKGLASTSLGTGPRGRQLEQLAEPVEAAIREAARCEDLLPGEAARASELLDAWRTSSACEAKLSRALRDGCSAATLSRVISEAAAAGVKVTSAKRILKLQQLLDAAVTAAGESAVSVAGVASSGRGQLVAKLEAAEAGGVAPSVLQPARQLLRKLLAVDARHALEAALKPHSDWCANTRISTLRSALDKAEEALGCSVQEFEEQQQHERQQGGDVPQQQDQQQKGASDAASASDAAEQCKQQQAARQRSRPATSAACSVSTAASSAGGSKGVHLQQQLQLMRTDSVASSDACSEASSLAPSSTTGGGGSTAGDAQHSSRHGSGAGGGIEPEVSAALQELSLRAWQLLQQDQQQLEERERERLEQERESRERERKERQRAEAERAERGKAEREKAAQERKAARAKAAAERAKAFTVVFGTSAGSSYSSSSGNSSSTAGAGASAHAGGSKQRDTARHSVDSSSGGAGAGQGDVDRLQGGITGDADAAPGPNPGSASGQTGKRWGPSRQQEARTSSSASPAAASKSGGGHKGTAVRSSSPAAAAAAAGRGADSSSSSSGRPPVVALAHARCDSFEILGDEHSKLGLDMLALLESPEDSTSAPNSTTAASQQQQPLLRASASVEAPPIQPPQVGSRSGSSVGVDGGQQQQQQQQHACDAAAGGGGSSQPGSSHPATPKFNLVDLGGASWGVDAEGLAPGSAGRPGSAGGGIRSLSPGAAAAARVTAAMDSGRHCLDLQVGAAGPAGSGANMWRSPLGLGIEGPAAGAAVAGGGGGGGLLPPLAPVSRGQQLPSTRQPGAPASQGGRALTDDEQQQLASLTSRGANSFDPVSSPAGKISPVGTAVTTLGGTTHVPEPAFLHRYGLGGTGSGSGSDAGSGMGLSSPRSYPQLQQAHPSLLQHQLNAHSQGMGDTPLLSSFSEGSATQTAAAISSMAGGSEPFWLLQQAAAMDQQQQQQQLAGRSGSGLVTSSGMLQLGGGASVFSSMPQPALTAPDALQLQYEQQLLHQQQLLQLQQYQQQQQQGLMGGQAGFAAGAGDHLTGAGLLPAAPHARSVNAAAGGAAQGPLGGVGALSGSFAFGAPYSSSFSPAPMRGSSSLGGVPAGDAGEGLAGREGGVGSAGSVCRPELLLPDDLNFSPPSSSGPVRWLE